MKTSNVFVICSKFTFIFSHTKVLSIPEPRTPQPNDGKVEHWIDVAPSVFPPNNKIDVFTQREYRSARDGRYFQVLRRRHCHSRRRSSMLEHVLWKSCCLHQFMLWCPLLLLSALHTMVDVSLRQCSTKLPGMYLPGLRTSISLYLFHDDDDDDDNVQFTCSCMVRKIICWCL